MASKNFLNNIEVGKLLSLIWVLRFYVYLWVIVTYCCGHPNKYNTVSRINYSNPINIFIIIFILWQFDRSVPWLSLPLQVAILPCCSTSSKQVTSIFESFDNSRELIMTVYLSISQGGYLLAHGQLRSGSTTEENSHFLSPSINCPQFLHEEWFLTSSSHTHDTIVNNSCADNHNCSQGMLWWPFHVQNMLFWSIPLDPLLLHSCSSSVPLLNLIRFLYPELLGDKI